MNKSRKKFDPYQPSGSGFFGGNGSMNTLLRTWNRERAENTEEKYPNFNIFPVTFDSVRALAMDINKLKIEHTLIADDTKFLTEEYTGKSSHIDGELMDEVKRFWKEFPLKHLRSENANIIAIITTSLELFCYLSETALEEDSNMPCYLIDKFADHLGAIERMHDYGYAEVYDVAAMLDFRNEVIDSIRNIYRVKKPLYANRPYCKPRNNIDKYCPYDYEWFCAHISAGPWKMNAVKYLCNSRIAQQNLTGLRLEILAAKEDIVIDNTGNLRAPLPTRPTDHKLLLVGLNSRESVYKDLHEKTLTQLSNSCGHTEEYRFTRTLFDLSSIQADIRKKKRSVADSLTKATDETFRYFHLIVAMLTSVEVQLLLLNKTFSLFVDKKLGMYGKMIPKDIVELTSQIYSLTTTENVKCPPTRSEINGLIQNLREKTRAAIKRFFMEEEEKCEKIFQGNINIKPELDDHSFAYDLETTDFPPEASKKTVIEPMIRHLYYEQFELERLNLQLSQVKQKLVAWPSESAPPLTLNICPRGIVGFISNFEKVMPPDVTHHVLVNNIPMHHRLSADQYIASEIIRICDDLVHANNGIPSITEINQEFNQAFTRKLGDTVVDGLNATTLATQIAEIVCADIAVTDLRSQFKEPRRTAVTAREMGNRVADRFRSYIRTRQMFQQRREGVPRPQREVQVVQPDESTDDDSDDDMPQRHGTDEQMVQMFQNMSLGEEMDDIDDDMLAALIYCQESNELFAQYVEIPEQLVDHFLSRVTGVLIPDLSGELFNVPLD